MKHFWIRPTIFFLLLAMAVSLAACSRAGNEIEHCQRDIQIDAQNTEGLQEYEEIVVQLPRQADARKGGVFQTKQEGKKDGEDQIGKGTRQSRQRHIPLGIFEIPHVDGDGMCPTESAKKHAKKSDGMEMLEGVQGEAPHVFRRRVSELIRRVSVGGLVNRQREKNDGKAE